MAGEDVTGIFARTLPGLEDPSVDEFVRHPDRRQVAAFFLGWVFISSINAMFYSTFLRSFFHRVNGLFQHLLSHDDDSALSEKESHAPSSSAFSAFPGGGHDTLIFTISLCFAFASIAYFGSVLTFNISSGAAACAFVVAWGGMAGHTARLIGLLVLSFDLRGMGIKRLESIIFWIVLGSGMVMTFVSNAISVGTLKFAQQIGTALCYREHFLPTSLISSLIFIFLEIYIIVRLWTYISPGFLQLQHQVFGLRDIRMMRALSLLLLDLLIVVPDAMSTNILGDFIPFSLGSLIVLAAFNYRPSRHEELKMSSIPPSRSGTTGSGGRSGPGSVRSTVIPPRPYIPNHPYSVPLSQRDDLRSPTGTVRSSRTFDTHTAKSIKDAVVQVASRAPRVQSRTVTGLVEPSQPQRSVPEKAAQTRPSLQGHGRQESRQILPMQAQYAERFASAAEPPTGSPALTPTPASFSKRPAVKIVTTPAEPLTPNRRESRGGGGGGLKSAVSSVVYGSDIIRRSKDMTRHHSSPPTASPSSYSPYSPESHGASPARSYRRYSTMSFPISPHTDDLSVVMEGSGESSGSSHGRRVSRTPTFGGRSARSTGHGSLLTPSHQPRPPIPPLPVLPSRPEEAYHARQPSTPRLSSAGIIRGPRPPPVTHSSYERRQQSVAVPDEGEQRKQRRRSNSTPLS